MSISGGSEEARGPHGCVWDNVTLSSSDHVEQTSHMMSKAQSGTFPVIYRLHNVQHRDHMLLAPILERQRLAPDFTPSKLRPSTQQLSAYLYQCQITVIKVLFKYINQFPMSYTSQPCFQYLARRPLPSNLRTKFWPLRLITIEEMSVAGNLLVQDNIYEEQLGFKEDDPVLSSLAIVTICDQLTNARVRGCQMIREGDLSPWLRRQSFQIGIGLFHLLMNLIWCLLLKHRGTMEQTGSLSFFFAILEKKRLGGQKPDFHTLWMALRQILDGLILNSWRTTCGTFSLADFANSKPTPAHLFHLANIILKDFATPMPVPRDRGSIVCSTPRAVRHLSIRSSQFRQPC